MAYSPAQIARRRRLGLSIYFACAFIGLVTGSIALSIHVAWSIERSGKLIHYRSSMDQVYYKRLEGLQFACAEYKQRFGMLPVTDDESTWYGKLADENLVYPGDYWGTSSDPFLPLDPYGHPIVMQSRTPVPRGNTRTLVPVFRMVGENGIDDRGNFDDYDVRWGARWGYWHMANWPEARVAALAGAMVVPILGLLTFALVPLRCLETVAFWSASVMIVLPAYADAEGWDLVFLDSPSWFGTVHGVGILLGLATLVHALLWLNHARNRCLLSKDNHCWRCDYDVHESPGRPCPECGANTSSSKRLMFDLWAFGKWHDINERKPNPS